MLRHLAVALLAVCLPGAHALGIESQLLGTVRDLPPELYLSVPCGTWSASGSQGYLRLVVVSVYGGAGSETYLQRIETPEQGSQTLKLVETVGFAELNNDHSQYSVSSAHCTRRSGHWVVELVAAYEHDGPGVKHRIRISMQPPYRVLNRRVRLR